MAKTRRRIYLLIPKPNKMNNKVEYTEEQLEQMLKTTKAKKAKKREKAKKDYEAKRDANVERLVKRAIEIAHLTETFKTDCHEIMEEQGLELSKYGLMRSNSKGGFSLTNLQDNMRVIRRRDTQPTWDERSDKAIELIKSFLSDTVKKRDGKLFEILMGFLERNKNGDLEYSRVMDLYQHEDKFADARWKEGLKLIKESFHNHFKGFGYEFKTKDETGKWQSIQINFSSL